MTKVENIHLMMSPEENIMDRLEFINIKPEYILAEGLNIELIKNKFAEVKLAETQRADLIISVIKLEDQEVDLEKICENWRKKIKPEGMILFVLVEVELDIVVLGDYLAGLNFINIVIDIEGHNIYGHMIGPKEMSIKLDQIKKSQKRSKNRKN